MLARVAARSLALKFRSLTKRRAIDNESWYARTHKRHRCFLRYDKNNSAWVPQASVNTVVVLRGDKIDIVSAVDSKQMPMRDSRVLQVVDARVTIQQGVVKARAQNDLTTTVVQHYTYC